MTELWTLPINFGKNDELGLWLNSPCLGKEEPTDLGSLIGVLDRVIN
jgi:hypothetical protein